MATIKQQLEIHAAYQQGLADGIEVGRKQEAESLRYKQELQSAQIKLINAVGQAMQVNVGLLSGLGQPFDCGPRP